MHEYLRFYFAFLSREGGNMNSNTNSRREISTYSKTSIALSALFVCASTWTSTAQAASVDLVTNITLVNQNAVAQTFVPIEFNVEFANRLNTATNSVGSITFPEGLSAISLRAATRNPPGCPAGTAFVPIPSDTTTGGEKMSATLPQLQCKQSCNYVLSVTPVHDGTAYSLNSNLATSAADTEVTPATNSSSNPFAVIRSSMKLQVTKALVGTAAYGTATKFKVTYSNLSTTPISLGATQSSWTDWEGTLSPQITPVSSTMTGFACNSSISTSQVCQAVQPSANVTAGTNVTLYSSNFTNQVMQAGEVITITYDRTYVAPQCGDAVISNTNWWDLAGNIIPQWVPEAGATVGDNEGNVQFTLANPAACKAIPLTWNASKKLVGVVHSGALGQNMSILSDTDQALYDLVIDLTDPANTAIINDATIPTSSKTVPFNIYDVVKLANGSVPLPMAANSVLTQMEWISCTEGSGANCDGKFQAPKIVQAYRNNFTPAANQWVNVDIGKKVTLRLALTYKMQPAPICIQQTDQLINESGFSVLKPADGGYMYTEIVPSGRLHLAAPLSILPNTPYCVNLTTNQSVTPTEVPTDTTPVTFTVTFENNSAPNGPESVDLAAGTTTLGSSFKASSASCTVSGSATVPSGSLLSNISGADNQFKVNIANMARGAKVTCTITGNVLGTNSFDSIATIALASTSAKLNGQSINNVVDPFPTDDKAYVNYRTPGAVSTGSPTPVPGNTPWGLAIMGLLIAGFAYRQRAKLM